MRRIPESILLGLLLATGVALADPVLQQQRAADLLDALDAGRWEDARRDFDDTLRVALDAERLRQTWQALPAQLGAASGRGPTHPEQVNGMPALVTPLHYALTSLDALITFDAEDRINGFRLVPGKTPRAAPAPAPETAPFSELDMSIGDPDRPLPATLALPKGDGPFPAVLLVHGSGPNDRDGRVGPNKPLRDLAWGLASRGIATLRYDKRSLVRPQDFADGNYTVQEEVVADALAAAHSLRRQRGIDRRRVFIIGHSLGALLAPRILAGDRRLAGAVLLAPPLDPLADKIVEQSRYIAALDGEISADEKAALDRLGTQCDAVQALLVGRDVTAQPLPFGIPAAYWRDLAAYDPIATAQRLRKPLLILRGERDYQVTRDEFARWRAAGWGNDVRFISYPALDHLFRAGEGLSSPADYARQGYVDERVIADIAQWIANPRH